MSFGRARVKGDRILVLSRDPAVIAAARAAATRVRRTAAVLETGREALAILTAPGHEVPQLVCDPTAAGSSWRDLLAAASEFRGSATLLVVSDRPIALPHGMTAIPVDAVRLAAALGGQPSSPAAHQPEVQALRTALTRGEIAVRYQPIVRVADRLPVLVEALARWEPRFPPIGPERFVPLAARAGLTRALSIAVVSRAASELGAVAARLRVGVTVNIPPDLLVQRDLPHWLGLAIARSGLRPCDLVIELTEAGYLGDRSALERALVRLRAAGHRVLLDDVMVSDARSRFFGLPFSGLKLDRSLVAALPRSSWVREHTRRLTRAASARGQVVIAEGVAQLRQLALLGDLGVGLAQGFSVGRPLPANALPSWSMAWRGGRAR